MPPLRSDSNSETRGETTYITRACDTCRRKKIRCQPLSDICAQCLKSKSPCHFTPIAVTKSRRRIARDKRVEQLEHRLAELESRVKQPPLVGGSFTQNVESDTAPRFRDTPVISDGQPPPSIPNSHGETFLDSADPDLEDPAGVSQISNVATPSYRMLFSEPTRLDVKSNATGNRTSVFQELPSKEKALRLITNYFRGVNTVYPIFEQKTFLSKFDSSYIEDASDSDPGWWASLNVVLALAYHFWELPPSDPTEDNEAWGYFQNALTAINQLITRFYTLASVQALLGLAIIMMSLPHQRPMTLLISSAIKIAQSLGLHRQWQGSARDDAQSLERSRVFWLAYTLDKDISLQTGQPPTQGDEDMDIQLPSRDQYGSDPTEGFHQELFYFRTRLAIIQGSIYKRLLSVSAEKQSPGQRAMAAEELETALQTWRRSVPIDLFCDYSVPSLSPLETPRHPVYLQLSYFKTLAVIHGSLRVLPWYSEIESSQVRMSIMSNQVAYPVEARGAIRLLSVTPRRKLACVWTALHVFVAAATTLLTHTISDPSNPLVQTDFGLLGPFLNLLAFLARNGESEQVGEMYRSSKALFEQARMVVGPYLSLEPATQWQIGQAGPGERETMENFLERMKLIRSDF